jgi:hypothetical protein
MMALTATSQVQQTTQVALAAHATSARHRYSIPAEEHMAFYDESHLQDQINMIFAEEFGSAVPEISI